MGGCQENAPSLSPSRTYRTSRSQSWHGFEWEALAHTCTNGFFSSFFTCSTSLWSVVHCSIYACEFSRTWSDDLSRPCLHQQLLPVQVLDGKLAATECLADRYLLVHPQVNADSLEDRVFVFLEDDNDIACITVRLGRGGGGMVKSQPYTLGVNQDSKRCIYMYMYMLGSLTISSALPLNGIFCSCLMPGEIFT